MKTSNPGKVSLLLCVVAVAATLYAAPALAKNKPTKPAEKYSVEQVGATPNFTVTNDSKKNRIIDIELALYDASDHEQTSKAWEKQVIAPGASATYSLGQLFLTPAGSPYHVVASIFKNNKKHKLIETVDPAGSFIVVH